MHNHIYICNFHIYIHICIQGTYILGTPQVPQLRSGRFGYKIVSLLTSSIPDLPLHPRKQRSQRTGHISVPWSSDFRGCSPLLAPQWLGNHSAGWRFFTGETIPTWQGWELSMAAFEPCLDFFCDWSVFFFLLSKPFIVGWENMSLTTPIPVSNLGAWCFGLAYPQPWLCRYGTCLMVQAAACISERLEPPMCSTAVQKGLLVPSGICGSSGLWNLDG